MWEALSPQVTTRFHDLVNFKYCRIFNGVFEKQKSTRNRKILHEMRAKNAPASRVYHPLINHDRSLQDLNLPLKKQANLCATPAVSLRGRSGPALEHKHSNFFSTRKAVT
jgi:hypothetical protein